MNTVAIVGRPNTGKSTLFNKIVGKRISIVKDEPNITRDRIYAKAEWSGREFNLIDTGGIDRKDESEMGKHIQEQARLAISLADVVLFVVDSKTGVTNKDAEAAEVLRRSNKPVVVVVNKVDNTLAEGDIYDFYSLGFSDMFAVSATHGLGTGDLLDKVISLLPEKDISENKEDVLKLAIVGRPNAGKSSLINKLTKENRLVVSSVAGTTRDAVELPFKLNGKEYLLTDTAGIRKKGTIAPETVESYSVLRSLDAINNSDVCLLIVDSQEGLLEQDINILDYLTRQGKPSVLVMNKWDLTPNKNDKTMNEFTEKVKNKIPFMPYVKIVFSSALTGQRINEIIKAADLVYENSCRRISTGLLNELLSEAFRLNAPPNIKTKRLKLLYATEAEVKPPKFIMFVNDASLMTENYKRYLENFIRKSVDFTGTPIIIEAKSRREDQL